MKKLTYFLLILTFLLPAVNFVLAQEASPAETLPIQWAENTTPDPTPIITSESVILEPIITNTTEYNFSAGEVYGGQKIKAFDNKFVFQIDAKTINSDTSLVIKEMILPPGSNMAPPNGLQLGS